MNRRSTLLLLIAASLALQTPASTGAQGQCEQCDLPPGCRGLGNQKPPKGNGNGNGNQRNCQRLTVTIESDIDFGRIVVLNSGDGRVLLDLTTGQRTLIGELDSLGGMPIVGQATVTGAPFEALRIRLPSRVDMRDATGGQAEVAEFMTDLPALPTLDANGQLTFRFSGTLVLTADTEPSGRLRGRVPITVEYP